MFQEAFSQWEKGPCYIQKDKSAKEKKATKADLDTQNSLTEKAHKTAWELENNM